MAKRVLVVLGVAVALAATSCGGSDGGSALDDAVTAALKASATTDDAGFVVDDALIGGIKIQSSF